MTPRELTALFPEVTWDRYVGTPKKYILFGWIPRKDGQRDFVLINDTPSMTTLTTSSAKYSAEFSRRLGSGSHTPCRPASELLGPTQGD